MSDMKKAVVRTESNRAFVGRAWKNTSKSGIEYLNISFDQNMEVTIKDTKTGIAYEIPANANIQMFANNKREGKKDADYRLSFQVE